MSFFWDLFQQSQIRDLQSDIARARSEAQRHSSAATSDRELLTPRLDALERRVELLALTTDAMWRLVADRLNLTDKDLSDKVYDVDLSDGELDNRLSTPGRTPATKDPAPSATPSDCAKCGRVIPRRASRCIYCGELK